MYNNYKNYKDNDITRSGVLNSFHNKKDIKPSELLNNNTLFNSVDKRAGFDNNSSIINNLNNDVLKLNNRINSLLIAQNNYDTIKEQNFKYAETIETLQNELNNYKNNITILSSDITKLKELIYEKYNNDKYHLIRNISQKTKVNFDIVHIICNKLNVKENNINKGIINEIMDSINKYNEKLKEVDLSK